MAKVELFPLAVVDLSLCYARRMGGKKLKHYSVSAISLITGLGGDPFTAVEDYIKNEEGQDTEVVLITPPSRDAALRVEDVTKEVLGENSRIAHELKQKQIQTQLYQYTAVMDEAYATYLERPFTILNKLAVFADKCGLFRFIPEKYKVRQVVPVSYLSYRYDEPDKELAFKALKEDLELLSKRGLILGHLSMPFTIELADVVGNGFLPKVVACFVFADLNKMAKQLGKSMVDMPRLPLAEIGVKGSNFEGGIGPSVGETGTYEIEFIHVGAESSTDKRRQAVIENYEENKETVNKVAKSIKDRSDRYQTLGSSNVAGPVDMDKIEVLDKTTGEVITGLDNLKKRLSQ